MRPQPKYPLFVTAILTGVVLSTFTASPARAAAGAPEKFVNDSLDRFARQLSASSSDKLEGLRAQVRDVVDFDLFAERSLGGKWQSLTADERRQFTSALRALLESRYMGAPKQVFDKGKITIKGGKAVGDNAEVNGLVKRKDVDIEVVLHLKDAGTGWRVFDVVIDGMSLAGDYKTQFDAFLKKKTIAALTERLTARAAAATKPPAEKQASATNNTTR